MGGDMVIKLSNAYNSWISQQDIRYIYIQMFMTRPTRLPKHVTSCDFLTL